MEKETKRCPYCGEEILEEAKKCKHCGEWLENNEESQGKTGKNDKSPTMKTDGQNSGATVSSGDSSTLNSGGSIMSTLIRCLIWFVIIIVMLEFLDHYSNSNMPSIEGKWESSYSYNNIDTLDSNIMIQTSVDPSTDLYYKNKTENENTIATYSVIDSEDDTVIATLKYEIDYNGTWEQDGDKIVIEGKSIDFNLLESDYDPERIDLEDFEELQSLLQNGLEESKEEELKRETLTISHVDFDANTITLVDEEGETIIMKKDGKINSNAFAKFLVTVKNMLKGLKLIRIR